MTSPNNPLSTVTSPWAVIYTSPSSTNIQGAIQVQTHNALNKKCFRGNGQPGVSCKCAKCGQPGSRSVSARQQGSGYPEKSLQAR